MKASSAVDATLFLIALAAPALALAQSDANQVREQMQRVAAAVRACEESLTDTPLAKRFRDELFPNDSHPNRYAVLASKEKLTDEQKQFLLQALPVMTKCRQVRIEGEAGLPIQRVSINHFGQQDIVYGKLLRGEISIGEANSERKRVISESNAAVKRLSDELRAQQNSGGSGSSSSSSLLPLLMQQQMQQGANDAADQRNRELIDALKPRQSTTECTRNAWGAVTCKTR